MPERMVQNLCAGHSRQVRNRFEQNRCEVIQKYARILRKMCIAPCLLGGSKENMSAQSLHNFLTNLAHLKRDRAARAKNVRRAELFKGVVIVLCRVYGAGHYDWDFRRARGPFVRLSPQVARIVCKMLCNQKQIQTD